MKKLATVLFLSLFAFQFFLSGCSSSSSGSGGNPPQEKPKIPLKPGMMRASQADTPLQVLDDKSVNCSAQFTHEGFFKITGRFVNSDKTAQEINLYLKESPGVGAFVLGEKFRDNYAHYQAGANHYYSMLASTAGTLKVTAFKREAAVVSGEFEFDVEDTQGFQKAIIRGGEFLECPIQSTVDMQEFTSILTSPQEFSITLKAEFIMNDDNQVDCESKDGRCLLPLLTIDNSYKLSPTATGLSHKLDFTKTTSIDSMKIKSQGAIDYSIDSVKVGMQTLKVTVQNKVTETKPREQVLSFSDVSFVISDLTFTKSSYSLRGFVKGAELKNILGNLVYKIKDSSGQRSLKSIKWESAELEVVIR